MLNRSYATKGLFHPQKWAEPELWCGLITISMYKKWDVLFLPFLNFNGGLVKPTLWFGMYEYLHRTYHNDFNYLFMP